MWNTMPQKVIGATQAGAPIHFHFDRVTASKMSSKCQLEASQHHDRLRNRAAVHAQTFQKNGHTAAANGYRKLAQHHAAQSQKYSKMMGL